MRYNAPKTPLANTIEKTMYGGGDYSSALEGFENGSRLISQYIADGTDSMEANIVSRVFSRIMEMIRNFINWVKELFTKRSKEQTVKNIESAVVTAKKDQTLNIPVRRQMGNVDKVRIGETGKAITAVKIKPTDTDFLLMGNVSSLSIEGYLSNISILTDVTEKHMNYLLAVTEIVTNLIDELDKKGGDIGQSINRVRSLGEQWLNTSEPLLKKAGFDLEVFQKVDAKVGDVSVELMYFDVRKAKPRKDAHLILNRVPMKMDVNFIRPANERVKKITEKVTVKMDAISKQLRKTDSSHPSFTDIVNASDLAVKIIPLSAATTLFTNVLIDATHGIVMDLAP